MGRRTPPATWCLVWALAALLGAAVAEDVSADAAPAAGEGGETPDAADETKELLSQLTITMVSEVIDERTIEVRDAKATGGRKVAHIRLGNVAAITRDAGASEEEHSQKVLKAKEGLTKLVNKQMIWFKAAPEEHQPAASDEGVPHMIIADAWLIDGRHLPTFLVKEGHLAEDKQYHSDLARNILSAEADEHKKESYKKLEQALRESEEEKQRLNKIAVEEEKMKGQPIGKAGWFGIITVGVIVLGALVFGRSSKKKNNANRKRGFFEKLWKKVKGA